MTRAVRLSFVAREDLGWLLPSDREASGPLTDDARRLLEVLHDRGALFTQDLRAMTGLLASQVERALGELMARGLVTADGFVAVRAMDRPSSRGRRRTRTRGTRSSGTENDVGATHLRGGRWTSFPGPIPLAGEGERAERWARQLLDRYGMMCRDLLSRETAAPAWTDLVRVLRRLEARGEIRGGRFVTDLAGEQFATAAALERLRSLRDERPGEEWVVISGVDPLNLTGILDSGKRVPAISGATLLLVDGHVVARRHAGTATVSADVDPITAERMSTALELGPCFRSYLSDTAAIASGRPLASQERSQERSQEPQERSQEWRRERPRSRARSRGGRVHRRGS